MTKWNTYEPERDSRAVHQAVRKSLSMRALDADADAVRDLRRQYMERGMCSDEYEQYLQNIIDGEY